MDVNLGNIVLVIIWAVNTFVTALNFNYAIQAKSRGEQVIWKPVGIILTLAFSVLAYTQITSLAWWMFLLGVVLLIFNGLLFLDKWAEA